MTELALQRVVLDADGVRTALDRMAHDARTGMPAQGAPSRTAGGPSGDPAGRRGGAADASAPGLAIVGIHTEGVHLARRLADRLEGDTGHRPAEGTVDITLYRDDVLVGLPQPVVGPTELPFDVTGTDVLLVDDVLYTGRTVRAALAVLTDYGRPARVRLAVLVDRGHRELPIRADLVGVDVPTQPRDHVRVELTEAGYPRDRVALYGGAPA